MAFVLGRSYGRRAFLLDMQALVVLFAFLLVLLPLFIPLLFSARELAKRTTCAANLKGIGMGLHTYANDGNQGMPIAAHAKADSPEKGKVRYAPGMIGKHRGKADEPAAGESDDTAAELSTTRNLWTLVRLAASTPASFICPSSNDSKNDEDNPQAFWDFRRYSEVSYGYQVPYGKLGRPSAEGDQLFVLAADKGPYGAALEAGGKNPGVPTLTLQDPPAKWRPWNSLNHRGEGQNALYADAHVDFANRPTTGVKVDNIYTRWSDATGGTDRDTVARTQGTPPTGIETPWGDTDSLIYP
jgi:hypothetical protein